MPQAMLSNTLIIYHLPRQTFSECSAALCRAAESRGMVKWVELRSLRRILAVFTSGSVAAKALPVLKKELGHLAPDNNVLIGFSMTSVTPQDAPTCLRLPDRGRLLFVSPPVSPPNEWNGEGTTEEAPNAATNYDKDFNAQLESALRNAVNDMPISPISPGDGQVVRILEAQENAPALQITHD